MQKRRSLTWPPAWFSYTRMPGGRREVGPAIAYQRTRYAEWGTDKDEPRPEQIGEEDLPWERYWSAHPRRSRKR